MLEWENCDETLSKTACEKKHGSHLIFLMVKGSSATLDRLQIVALIQECSLFIDVLLIGWIYWQRTIDE